MVEIIAVIAAIIIILSMAGLGYFTIYRLTSDTHDGQNHLTQIVLDTEAKFAHVHEVISGLDKRFRDIETKLSLFLNDSHRITAWLDKRDLELIKIQDEFLKSQKISERESKIIEISEQLKLITKKK